MYHEAIRTGTRIFATAPMIDWSDRHYRVFARQMTRHMVGLFQGVAGARRYRQILSTEATKPGAGPDVIAAAFDAVLSAADRAEAAE